jgi:peptide/nickel transport system substrate-binding protein
MGRRPHIVGALVAVGLVLPSLCCAPPDGRAVAIARRSAPSTIDPHLHNEVSAWSLLSNFYDGLVVFSPRMELGPGLAMSWEWLDGQHVLFSLRPGVRFSNGQPLNAADVVASFERARTHPRSAIAHHLAGITKMDAVTDLSLVVETVAPTPTLLNSLAFLFVIPASEAGVDEIAKPVGTGPYRFVARDTNGSVTGEGWRSWRGEPRIQRFTFSFLDDDERVKRLVDGSLDIATNIPESLLPELRTVPGCRLLNQPNLAVRLLVTLPHAGQGEDRFALADPRVRRAMVCALDRTGLANGVLKGNAIVASQYVHPSVFGFDPEIPPLPYSQELARTLLTEAGFPSGFETTMAHGNVNPDIVRCLLNDWQAVGIRVRPRTMPFAEVLRAGREGRDPLVLMSRTSTTGDAAEVLDSTFHSSAPERGLGSDNYSRYSDPMVDAALERAAREPDPQKRLLLLQGAQRKVLEAMPVLPIVLAGNYVGASDRIEVVLRFDERLWVAGFRWR